VAKIYLSSTYTDLIACREAVYHVLRQMKHDVIAMEDYVATDQRPTEKCLADVAASDLYIGIFAWRYGYIPPEMTPQHKSITELEYRKALETGKSCLIFLLDEDATWSRKAMDEVTDEGNHGKYIKSLRRELSQKHTVSFFQTPQELANLVNTAVHLWEKNRPPNLDTSTTSSLLTAKQSERVKSEAGLKAILADHTGFLRNRLVSFVGREQELTEIRRRIAEHLPTGGYVIITGQAGQGKSSIIAKLVDEYGPENVAYHFIPVIPGLDHQVGLMRNLMARLILKYDLSDLFIASESLPALRDYFPHVLSDVSAKGGCEVIFVDGLDQLEEDARGVRDLSFLPTDPPPGIVFVLGTRPNDTLKPLELLKPHNEYRLPNLSREDFNRILQHRHVTLERTLADRFYQVMQENALYLDLVAQELAKSGGVSPEEIIERVATNPENLFSLSMLRLKRQKQEWREVVKPILGILLVAREPFAFPHMRQILHLDADQLREGMERLGGLISNDGSGRYGLFHAKFYDYLRQDEMNPQKDYIFAKDEEEHWHQTLANWCEQDNIQLIWKDTQSNRVEQERRVYARKHFIAHLYFAQDWDRVFEVLDARSFGQRKVRYDPSTRSYSEDLDLGRKAAASVNWELDEKLALDKGISQLLRLWRYTLLRCSLASRADRYPEAAFRVLMLLGREQEALGLAELLTNPAEKVDIFIILAEACEQQQKGEESREREERSIDLLMRAYEVATTIEDSYRRTHTLSKLATALAQAQEWAEAVRVIGSVRYLDIRVHALSELATALAQAHETKQAQALWTEAERVISSIGTTIKIGYSTQHVDALSELATALAQAREWAEAERVIASIEGSYRHDEALGKLATALVQAREWAEAERVIASIEGSYRRAEALSGLGAALIHSNKHLKLLQLVQHSWQQADTQDYAVALFSLANGFMPWKPEIGIELLESFSWVDDFLKG
jgi:Domain of unknown function (DUF4062)/AAA ATPase domain